LTLDKVGNFCILLFLFSLSYLNVRDCWNVSVCNRIMRQFRVKWKISPLSLKCIILCWKIDVLNAYKLYVKVKRAIMTPTWMLVKLINALLRQWIAFCSHSLRQSSTHDHRANYFADFSYYRSSYTQEWECKKRVAFRWYSLSISAVSNVQVLFALCAGILSSAYCAPRAFHWFSDKALLFFNSVDRKQQERKLNHPVALSFCSPIVAE